MRGNSKAVKQMFFIVHIGLNATISFSDKKYCFFLFPSKQKILYPILLLLSQQF